MSKLLKPIGYAIKGAVSDTHAKYLYVSKKKRATYDIPLYTSHQVSTIILFVIDQFISEKVPMKKIVAPALKEKKTGIIIEAPSKAWAHDQIEAKEHIKKKKVKEGFVTNEDKFVKRKEAAKIAKKAGQIKKDIKKLHSTDLRKAANIKKKEIK